MRVVKALLLAGSLPFSALSAAAATVDGQAIADEKAGANWLSYGRTYSEQRFSPLKEINAENVGNLGVAWYLDLPGQKSLLSTPLVVDGIMDFSGGYSVVFAIDTHTGKELWKYDPKTVDAAGDPQGHGRSATRQVGSGAR
jgi:quinohemoprotein ethanol dehydrogenase